MSGFDYNTVFTSKPLPVNKDEDDMDVDMDQQQQEDQVDHELVTKEFKEFIRSYQEGDFNYKYRSMLRTNYNIGQYWLEVNLQDLNRFNEDLYQKINDKPSEYLPLFEDAAREVADEVTFPRSEEQKVMKDIQVMFTSTANTMEFRELKSDSMTKLVKISGIVLTVSSVRSKAESISIMCRSCRSSAIQVKLKPGMEGAQLPRKCETNVGVQSGDVKCPLDPYFILADKCKCADFQMLKLQESPESVPSGEMPRHMSLYVDRFLCERAVPGNRVTVIGIYSIKKASQSKKTSQNKVAVGVRFPYVRVLGIQMDMDGSGRTSHVTYTSEEEEAFRRLAASPDCYERIARSIAPSIYGAEDIKKAIACLLFSGSRKRMPDGLTRRGDINVLLLGDPGTAKSQLLKFVEKVSPIAVYTSGKGSSAAGLTASVNRDPATKNFYMEGGAMVLADGGVVCIDEFDKMREDDRVAIHEAMEQQTISIAKAGITTTLNSRCSVFAAANSIFGRWDETKGDDNIAFMPTILSRFDMIFIVKDEHSDARDTTMAKHVMRVHMEAQKSGEQLEAEGELSLLFLKKYIAYCRSRCGPRLSEAASEKLLNRYVLMRSGIHEQELDTEKRHPISITVRQLEAVIRIAESLAKMQLRPFATESHIDEALRLFQISTLEAASTGSLAGVDGFTTTADQEMLGRLEVQLKRRFALGSQVAEHTIVRDFMRQKYEESAIMKVINTCVRREDFLRLQQGKLLYRVK